MKSKTCGQFQSSWQYLYIYSALQDDAGYLPAQGSAGDEVVRVVFRAGDGRPGWLASVEVTNGPCSPLSVPGWSLLLMERCPGGTRREALLVT